MDPKIMYLLLGAVIFLVILTVITLFILLKDTRKVNNRMRNIEEQMKENERRGSGSSRSKSRR